MSEVLKPDDHFVRGDSDNLPKVDFLMVHEFLVDNLRAESKNIKINKATKPSYGDNTIGYVQLQRTTECCIVKGRITPEHEIHKPDYNVFLRIDEQNYKILEAKCFSCATYEGGCKHGMAFLMWLHRKSEQPAPSDVTGYWKESSLKAAIQDPKNWSLSALTDKPIPELSPKGESFYNLVVSEFKHNEGGIFDLHRPIKCKSSSLYHLSLDFQKECEDRGKEVNVYQFISFLKSKMNAENCLNTERETRNPRKGELWYELRFGRITASAFYEAAHCKTEDDYIVKKIFDGIRPIQTPAILSRIQLKSAVLGRVEHLRNIKIEKAGLFTDPDFPIYGASPDGISENYTIEVKCPNTRETFKNYLIGKKLTPKYEAQVQLQMLLTKKRLCLFCVADPKFKINNTVTVVEVAYDEDKFIHLFDKSFDFWKSTIFPKLM